MPLADEVQLFCTASEKILSPTMMSRPLTREDAAIIEYYCLELLAKIAPLLQNPE